MGGVMSEPNPGERPPKPTYRFNGRLPAALEPLASKRQWVTWNYVWNANKGKWDKPPLSARPARGRRDQ